MNEHLRDCAELTRAVLATWPFAVRSQACGAWLELTVDPPQAGAVSALELLRRNGELPGGVKFVLARTERRTRIQLRAEVPLDVALADVRRRLDLARRGFGTALAHPSAPPVDTSDGDDESTVDLDARVREAGWPTTVRGDGSLSIDLAVPEEFLPAEIEARPGATLCSVSLATPESDFVAAPAAAALLLLRAGAVIRLARPALPRSPGPARFEVVLDRAPTTRELDHALAALAVVCRLFAREIDVVLRSEAVATRVLARLGGGTAALATDPQNDPPLDHDHFPNREEERWHRLQPQR